MSRALASVGCSAPLAAARPRVHTARAEPLRPVGRCWAPHGTHRKVVARASKDELAKKAEELKKSLETKAGELKEQLEVALPKSREELTKIELGLSRLVVYNFAIQAVLTAVSWAVLGVTFHQQMGKGVNIITLPTLANFIGVIMSAFSAFTSYSYMTKVQTEGEKVLDGFEMMQRFFDHLQVNFIGAIAAIIGLQAEVGAIFMTTITGGVKAAVAAASSGEAAFAQAAANTTLAHLVSIMFLVYMIRKISWALQKQIDWSMKLRETVASLK